MENATGIAHHFGDDVDTDLIIAARYLTTSDPDELAKYCMEDADPEFAGKVRKHDVIVAGKNFGCGSSREHAPIAIKAAGVQCVIAKSFARIFYRNAFNMGLAILECPQVDEIPEGATLSVDYDTGKVTDVDTGKTWDTTPIPPFMQELVAAGGLIARVKEKLASQ